MLRDRALSAALLIPPLVVVLLLGYFLIVLLIGGGTRKGVCHDQGSRHAHAGERGGQPDECDRTRVGSHAAVPPDRRQGLP